LTIFSMGSRNLNMVDSSALIRKPLTSKREYSLMC
jgi:hypothetical protein